MSKYHFSFCFASKKIGLCLQTWLGFCPRFCIHHPQFCLHHPQFCHHHHHHYHHQHNHHHSNHYHYHHNHHHRHHPQRHNQNNYIFLNRTFFTFFTTKTTILRLKSILVELRDHFYRVPQVISDRNTLFQ